MRVTRGIAVRYIKVGARGLRSQAGWPLARLEVTPGEARTKLFGTSLAIPSSTPVEVREAEYEFGARVNRTVLAFHLAAPQSGVETVAGRAEPTVGVPIAACFLTGSGGHGRAT